jgi:hypothetical protein
LFQLTKAAKERNELVRSAFIARITKYTPDQLIFLDEAAKDERTLTHSYGYALANVRAQKKVVFVRGKRYTMLPALSLDGILALDVMEGSCTKDRFQEFILSQVVSEIFVICFFPFVDRHIFTIILCLLLLAFTNEPSSWKKQCPCFRQCSYTS